MVPIVTDRGQRLLASLTLITRDCSRPWSAAGQTPGEERLADAIGALPASFSGDLPCADCPGIRYQLDLYPDQAFVLRMTYQDRAPDNVVDDLGGLLLEPDGRTLVLIGGREMPTRFRIEDPARLRLLDRSGREIVSDLNYALTRAPSFTPIEPQLVMRGMYGYSPMPGGFRSA